MDKRKNHIIFWVGYFFYYSIIMILTWGDMFSPYTLFIKVMEGFNISIFTCYFFLYYLFPRTLPSKKYVLLLFYIVLSFFATTLISHFISILLHGFLNKKISYDGYSSLFFRGLLSIFRGGNIAFLFWFFKEFIEKLQEKKEMEIKSSILKQEILSSELLSLKNQINPHFFYNSLNFLYSQALPYSEKLSKNFLTLSNMMRYTIRENQEEQMVLLEEEIEYLKQYIYLENALILDETEIALEINGNVKFRRVPPMVLRMLLDNSFRFGVKNRFELIVNENHVNFVSTFSKKEKVNVEEIFEECEFIKNKILFMNSFSVTYDTNTQLYKTYLSLLS
jgi:two-component system LytT family sensor kinase